MQAVLSLVLVTSESSTGRVDFLKAAVLIIDAQFGLVEGMNIYRKNDVLDRIKNLSTLAHRVGWEVIYVMDDDIGQGDVVQNAIHPHIPPVEHDVVFHKTSTSVFFRTPLHEHLKTHNVERLIVAGFKTEACLDTSCRHAFGLGYQVTLVADGHSTSDTDELTAAQIIKHHNSNLHGLDNHEFVIEVLPLSEIEQSIV